MEKKQTTIQIGGMTCAACANRIETSLSKIDGVESANVNFALERATISFDPEKTDLVHMEQKINQLGYSTVKSSSDLQISGMTCAACANRIEKGLNKLPGVTRATVNLALETAHVEYAEAQVSLQDIMNKVTDLGYNAKLKEEKGHNDHRMQEISRQRTRLFVSAVLSFPLLWSMVGHFQWTSFIWVPDLFMNPLFQLILATPVQFGVGKQFYIGAYKALRNRSANMDVLVALGTSAAYFYSIYLTVAWLNSNGLHIPGFYFETSAILITLIILGKLFEARAKGRTSEAIKN